MGESFEDWCLGMGQVSSCFLRLETGEEAHYDKVCFGCVRAELIIVICVNHSPFSLIFSHSTIIMLVRTYVSDELMGVLFDYDL